MRFAWKKVGNRQ